MLPNGSSAAALSLACLATVSLLAGCAAQESRQPLRTTAVDTGAGTTESVRRQLEGTWILSGFTVFDGSGTPRTVEATGSLTYDAFGNLVLIGKIADPAAAGAHADSLAFKGRAVVDAAGRRIVLADLQGNVDASALPANMSPDKVRFYSFEGDTLSLETRDGTRVLARTVWKKGR
jgi:hypothetical protein